MHDHKSPQLIQIAPLEPQVARVQREIRAQRPHDHQTRFLVGLDVGSTTVKAVAVEADSDRVLWQDYQRHETKQPEKAIEMLKAIAADFPNTPVDNFRVFITGSGGSGIAKHIGAKFVQEVNAVSLAVEKLYPACGSVMANA